jgi:hypothetical protein
MLVTPIAFTASAFSPVLTSVQVAPQSVDLYSPPGDAEPALIHTTPASKGSTATASLPWWAEGLGVISSQVPAAGRALHGVTLVLAPVLLAVLAPVAVVDPGAPAPREPEHATRIDAEATAPACSAIRKPARAVREGRIVEWVAGACVFREVGVSGLA